MRAPLPPPTRHDAGSELAALVADVLPDAALVVDGSVEVVWCNRAAEELFGMTFEEARGRSGLEFVHPDDLQLAALSLISVQDKEVGTLLEIRVRSTDGWRLTEVHGTSLGDHTLLCLRDITERRRWELAGDETAKFRSLLQNSTTVTMLLDRNGTVMASSGALTRLLGHDQEVVEGSPLELLVVEEDRHGLRDALRRTGRDGATGAADRTTVEVRLVRADGDQVPYALSIVNLLQDPTVEGLVLSGHDISDRVRAEAALLESNSVLTATLEATADGILVADIEGNIASCNGRFVEIWAIPPEIVDDARASFGHILGQLRDPEEFVERVAELLATPEAESRDLIQLLDGRIIERDSRPQRVDDRVVGRVWSFRDVSEEQRLRDELTRQAFHDSLTGLANQALFRDRVEHAVERLARVDDRVAVLFVDLDDFKYVNDSLGHVAGDELLVAVADQLRAAVRIEDTVARLGGDEFAILIEDLRSDAQARTLAERVLELIASPVVIGVSEISCTASVGIAFGDAGSAVDELLRNADLAMYTAKGRGKGCHRVYASEMHAVAVARLETEANLRRAVRERELVVHYQPVWHISTGGIEAFEALVRWQHPERGLLGPDQFIPFAEQSGLIDLIGEYVLATACQEIASWAGEFGAHTLPRMSVNLSPRQLLDRGLPDRVRAILARNELRPEQLILEVTESALMNDPQMATASLHALRRLGVSLAVDDFGTGYSSLVYLKQFPIDILKIDKAFTDDVAVRPESSLAGAIVQLAIGLGLTPIAEGVECAEQVEALASLGCDLAQGFHLGRPVDAAATRQLLADSFGTLSSST